MTQRVVSVFGGAAPTPGTPAYQEAYTLGQRLAEADYAVMTGGYGGTMEAVSQGAQTSGGHVIGVTVGLFQDKYQIRPNPYINELIHYPTLHERLHHLVAHCDAAVALCGGVGTLSEVALTWSLLQVGEIALKPLVLIGTGWQRILDVFQAESYVNHARDMALLTPVPDVQATIPALAAWFDNPPQIPLRLGKD